MLIHGPSKASVTVLKVCTNNASPFCLHLEGPLPTSCSRFARENNHSQFIKRNAVLPRNNYKIDNQIWFSQPAYKSSWRLSNNSENFIGDRIISLKTLQENFIARKLLRFCGVFCSSHHRRRKEKFPLISKIRRAGLQWDHMGRVMETPRAVGRR